MQNKKTLKACIASYLVVGAESGADDIEGDEQLIEMLKELLPLPPIMPGLNYT